MGGGRIAVVTGLGQFSEIRLRGRSRDENYVASVGSGKRLAASRHPAGIVVVI